MNRPLLTIAIPTSLENPRLASENIDKIKGDVFNIGGVIDNSLSLLELFSFLEEELDIKMNYKKVNWRESDQKIFIANNHKVIKKIKWFHKISKEKGVKKVMEKML